MPWERHKRVFSGTRAAQPNRLALIGGVIASRVDGPIILTHSKSSHGIVMLESFLRQGGNMSATAHARNASFSKFVGEFIGAYNSWCDGRKCHHIGVDGVGVEVFTDVFVV